MCIYIYFFFFFSVEKMGRSPQHLAVPPAAEVSGIILTMAGASGSAGHAVLGAVGANDPDFLFSRGKRG